MPLKEKDFVELEFTGRLQDGGNIFDSNVKKDIEESGLKLDAKPFTFSLGQGMFLKAIDDFLIGKEIGKEYALELKAEDAFGLRDSKLIQLIPKNIFTEQNLNPVPGAAFNFDGKLGRILSVSGGRIRVDFNSPMAGKDVSYTLKVTKKVEKLDDQINSFNEFLFKKKFDFEIKGKDILMKVEKPLAKFVEMFQEKFKEIFNLELKITEIEGAIPHKH